LHYLVYGTGAVGGFLGTRLALTGQTVTFLARPRVVDTLKEQGIRLTGDSPPGWLNKPVVISSLAQAFENHPPDVILVAVKAYDCQAAADAIHATTTNPPPVVCLLNGIGNEDTLGSTLGKDRVIAAALTTAVQVLEPGLLRVERERGLGLAMDHPIVPHLQHEMIRAGVHTRLYRNREQLKWSKVFTNIVSNATSAILGWPPAAIFTHPGLYRLEIEALRETRRVMRSMRLTPTNLPKVPVGFLGFGLSLPASIIQPVLYRLVTKGRGDKLPSFHYDIGRGRSEVSWLNGAIAREGARRGVPTPANAVLTDTLLALVEGREEAAEYHNRPERLLSRARAAGVPDLGT
jgi:2-dehydropantoate 2-reductase